MFIAKSFVEYKVSSKRIVTFLKSDNVEINDDDKNDDVPSLIMDKCGFSLNKNDDYCILRNINFDLKGNQLIIVTGKIGSGKTLLLKAILDELYCKNGNKYRNGNISYQQQKSVVISMSFKDNILFGDEYNEEWYNKVIYSCGLTNDIKLLSNKDNTIIGEKGINLSGGQKTRLNLARCVYKKDCNIFLFDDPLSSVDTHISNHIFNNVLSNNNGILNNKLRILVTHQIQYLPFADQIILMDNNTIKYIGKYKDLKNDQLYDVSYYVNYNNIDNHKHITIDNYKTGSTPNSSTNTKLKSYIELNEFEGDQKDLESSQNTSTLIKPETQSKSSLLYLFLKLFSSKTTKRRIFNFIGIILFFQFTEAFTIGAHYCLLQWSVSPNMEIYRTLWIVFVIVGCIFAYIRYWILFNITSSFARYIHNAVFRSVLLAKRTFYEQNRAGRILNRFTKDISIIDDELPSELGKLFQTLFDISKFLFIPLFCNPWLYIPTGIFAIIYCIIIRRIVPKLKEIENINSITRSYVYNHFETICDGVIVIRNLGYKDHMFKQGCVLIDRNFAVMRSIQALQKFAQFCGVLCYVILLIIPTFIAVMYYPNDNRPVFTILSVVYLISVENHFVALFLFLRTIASGLLSVDRLYEYRNIDHENIRLNDESNGINVSEFENKIEIVNVSCKYRDELEYVLKDVNIKIEPKSRIGIVGRTGSGKSTLFLCLLKLIELDKGYININNKNIDEMELGYLRSLFSVIPQTPIIFSETIKYNLDPFNKYNDTQINDVLKDIKLYDVVSKLSDGINTILSSKYKDLNNKKNEDNKSNGFQLSYGESQLLCLGRALLNNKPFLLIDEGTSNIDNKTDKIIQDLLQNNNKLKNKTIITIAHRINTVINYNKIISIKNGNIIEYDSPNNLLNKNINDPNAIFKQLYNEMNLNQ